MLSTNKLYQGDCLKVMSQIESKSIDLILCDLPYGITGCSWDSIVPFKPLWEHYERIIKETGAIVLTASQPFTSALIMSNLKLFRYEWIWEKERPTNFAVLSKQVGKVHENICVFYKKQPVYNPIKEPAKQPKNNIKRKSQKDYMNIVEHTGMASKISNGYDNKTRYPRSVLKISRGTRHSKRYHPTQKPVVLFEYLIKTYTDKGDLVLDNCAGAGTTGIACINLERNYILIEKESKYITIIKKRLREARNANAKKK